MMSKNIKSKIKQLLNPEYLNYEIKGKRLGDTVMKNICNLLIKDRELLKYLLKEFEDCSCDYDSCVAVKEAIGVLRQHLDKDG